MDRMYISEIKVRVLQAGLDELRVSEDVAAELGEEAARVKARVKAPSKMRLSTRHGVSARGAYAQVSMTGPGAIAIEFGSKRTPPLAPLRKALG